MNEKKNTKPRKQSADEIDKLVTALWLVSGTRPPFSAWWHNWNGPPLGPATAMVRIAFGLGIDQRPV